MPMQTIPVASSMIYSVGYDPDTQQLEVTFNQGRSYTYEGVPQSEFDNLVSAQSAGKYFAANIKNVYRFS